MMAGRYIVGASVVAAFSIVQPATAKPTSPCGSNGCPTDTQTRPTTIIPSDAAQFRRLGDFFQNPASELNFAATDFVQVALGFSVDFGAGPTSTAYISKNGLVSFGAPLTTFQRSGSLQNLNLPVIAPFYADLAPAQNDGRAGFGDVVVQTGFADVYADGGAYSMEDLLPAVRITWNGIRSNAGAVVSAPPAIYAQLVIAGSADGSYSTFQFRYGTETNPGEEGRGSIAGFSLYGTTLEFGGPYRGTLPGFFEYADGRFIGQGATSSGAVPEPSIWAELILGFGLAGYVMRRRQIRLALA